MESYAVVTGASSGIGRAICLELAKRGYNLIMISKDEALLDTARQQVYLLCPDIQIIALPADLAKIENAYKIADECIKLNVWISILVNCAGYAVWTAFSDGNLEDQMEVINLNVYTPLVLIHKLLPGMKKETRSYILNVSSTTAFQATPFMSTYSGSKVLIEYFSRCLSLELKDEDIQVSCLIPGTTKTNFSNRAKLSDTIIKKGKPVEMGACAVAKIAIDGLFKGKKTIIPGIANKLHFLMTKILPSSIAAGMTYSIYKK